MKHMSLRNILKHRNAIYGFLALWIILFHINRKLGEPIQMPIIYQWLLCGNMAVDIFMFISGCCLFLSMDKKPDIKSFYYRRLLRLVPSYLLITLPFWIWRSLVEAPRKGGGFHVIRFFADISSSTFWLKGVEITWFVNAILLFYILFPFVFKIVKSGLKGSLLLLLVTYILNILATEFVPIYECSSIAWTRLPVFIIGVIAGKYIDELDLGRFNRKTRVYFVGMGSAILIISLFVFPVGSLFTRQDVKPEYLWLLYGPLSVCALVVLAFVLGSCLKCKREKKPALQIFDHAGKMSLELYMTHIIILHWFAYYGLLEKMSLWTFLVLPVLAGLWSVLASKIIHSIIGRV